MIPRISILLLGIVVYVSNTAQSATKITVPLSQKLYVQTGNAFTMECEQDNCEKVTWSKNNVALDVTSSSNFDVTTEQIPITGSACITKSLLTKTSVTANDNGNYKCQSKTGNFIMPISVVTVTGVDQELESEGEETVFLRCIVEGLTEIGPWVWYHNNTEIRPDNTKYIVHDINVTLEIRDADHKDIGAYNCTLNKDTLSLNQTVNLFSKPFVESFEKSKNLVQGDNLVLNAMVWAHPKPTVSWLKDGMPLDTMDARISLNSSMGVENASLRIINLDFADRAEYTILTSNIYGTGNATILVRVKDKLAALWPFLGIVCEVVILCVIIFIYERRRAKRMEEEEVPEEAGYLTNSNDHKGKDEVRQRKV